MFSKAGSDNRAHLRRKLLCEESPGSTGQGCRVTPGEGNFKESATEKKTADLSVRMKRRGKSSPAVWRHTGLVNPTRSNVVERHNCCPQALRRRLKPVGNGRIR